MDELVLAVLLGMAFLGFVEWNENRPKKPIFKITGKIENDNDGKLDYRWVAEPRDMDGVAKEYLYPNGEVASRHYINIGGFTAIEVNHENLLKYNKGYKKFQKQAEEMKLNGSLYARRKRLRS